MLTATQAPLWKPDWSVAKQHHIDWWNHCGPVLWITAAADRPHEDLPDPGLAPSLDEKWYGPQWRTLKQEYRLSRTYFGGDSFPMFSTSSGAGDLAAYLGCPVHLAPTTIWYEPIIADPPEAFAPLQLNLDNEVLQKTLRLIDLAVERSRGRYFISQPDIIENIDILASVRGTQNLLMDMIERPAWILARLREINTAYFEVFDLMYHRIKDADGGNTFVFNIWGPGRTAKVQCDACSMFGPDMFRQYVSPFLDEQCRRLDFAMYHLDGEECLVNLDALLEIESIQAIEWTPKMCYVGQGGGNPKWYDLYRRILASGKSVQAVVVRYDEVIPLLDAVGGAGMYIMVSDAPDEAAARRLEKRVEAYR